MRSKIIFLSMAAFFLFGNTLLAQDFTKQTRKTASFDAIRINCSADVYLTQGNNQSVVVETEKRNQDKILTRVQGNTLVITTKSYISFFTRRLRVYVEIPTIKSLEVNGSGNIHANSIQGNDLAIAIKGSGDVNVGALHFDGLTAHIVGSGDLSFSGQVSMLKLSITGSGDAHINNLHGNKADLKVAGSGDIFILGSASEAVVMLQGSGDLRGSQFTVSKAITNQLGSGDIHIHVNDDLSAIIKGSGDFYLGGNPKVVNSEIHGSGELHR